MLSDSCAEGLAELHTVYVLQLGTTRKRGAKCNRSAQITLQVAGQQQPGVDLEV